MALPIIPAFKLWVPENCPPGVGRLVCSCFTVERVVGGMGESVRLAANWLHSQGRLSSSATNDLVRLLQKVEEAELARPQARALLFALITKTIISKASARRDGFHPLVGFFKRW